MNLTLDLIHEYTVQRPKTQAWSSSCLLCQAVIMGAWIVITWRLILIIHRSYFQVCTFFTHLQWRPTFNSVLILICEAVGLACALIFARSVRIQPHRSLYVHIRALKNIYYVVYQKGVSGKCADFEPWASIYEAGLLPTCCSPHQAYSLCMYVTSQIWILQWQLTFS